MAESVKKLVINSEGSMASGLSQIRDLWKEHKYLALSVRLGKDRSAEQNKLWAALYKRIARDLKWTFKDARAHCKLYHGIPILRRDSEGFSQSFDRVFGELTEEAALRLMNSNKLFINDGFPVTRYFGTKQGVEYTESIVSEFSAQGVYFEDILSEEN